LPILVGNLAQRERGLLWGNLRTKAGLPDHLYEDRRMKMNKNISPHDFLQLSALTAMFKGGEK
jgi:hypothetical protein